MKIEELRRGPPEPKDVVIRLNSNSTWHLEEQAVMAFAQRGVRLVDGVRIRWVEDRVLFNLYRDGRIVHKARRGIDGTFSFPGEYFEYYDVVGKWESMLASTDGVSF